MRPGQALRFFAALLLVVVTQAQTERKFPSTKRTYTFIGSDRNGVSTPPKFKECVWLAGMYFVQPH